MKAKLLSVFLLLAVVSAFAETEGFNVKIRNFLPRGWQGGVTGQGKAKWTIEPEPTAPSRPAVLKQSGQGTYCWCVKTNTVIRNGFVEVKFKPIAGVQDQAAGLIWRFQDKDNYYVARANALEQNVTIYHTINGERTQFQRMHVKISTNAWHTLRVDFSDSHFEVKVDNKRTVSMNDETFKKGAVGVWTKGDSVTLFDDFQYQSDDQEAAGPKK